jgi:23S rRNA pseudouridine2457 synthase
MNASGCRYFILNKPYGMESQFESPYPNDLLGMIHFDFPEGTHAIGRLDKNSEGLLLLTTNKKITALLFEKYKAHKRTYLVKVKHKVSQESLQRLRTGVTIRIRGGEDYQTPPCSADLVEEPADLFPLPYPVSKYVESAWLRIIITEGKYHQVRKMTSAIRHRCMRLIRVAIEDLKLGDLQPGQVREVDESFFFEKLKLAPIGESV